MRNKEDENRLIEKLANSTEFMHSLVCCSKNMEGKVATIVEIGLWFYSSGYMNCLDDVINEQHKNE